VEHGAALSYTVPLAQWALLAIIVLGGVPLLFQTLRQLAHHEFGVDVIAILAIAGSAALDQYLAGTFIVLMLPAARRSRPSP
jgi:hypothetical protein